MPIKTIDVGALIYLLQQLPEETKLEFTIEPGLMFSNTDEIVKLYPALKGLTVIAFDEWVEGALITMPKAKQPGKTYSNAIIRQISKIGVTKSKIDETWLEFKNSLVDQFTKDVPEYEMVIQPTNPRQVLKDYARKLGQEKIELADLLIEEYAKHDST